MALEWKKFLLNGEGGAGKWVVETKTDTYNVLLTDVAKTLVMDSADNKIFHLPSVAGGDVGTWFTFVKAGTGTLLLDAADSDTIDDSAAGAGIYNEQADETFATMTLQLVTETKWAITGARGIWTTAE